MLLVEKFLLVLPACAGATLSCPSQHPDEIRERVQLTPESTGLSRPSGPNSIPLATPYFIPSCGLQGHARIRVESSHLCLGWRRLNEPLGVLGLLADPRIQPVPERGDLRASENSGVSAYFDV